MSGANSSLERSLLGRCSPNSHKEGAMLQQLPEGAGATGLPGFFFCFAACDFSCRMPSAQTSTSPAPQPLPPPAYDNVAYIPKESSRVGGQLWGLVPSLPHFPRPPFLPAFLTLPTPPSGPQPLPTLALFIWWQPAAPVLSCCGTEWSPWGCLSHTFPAVIYFLKS